MDTSDLIDAKIRTPRPAYLTPLQSCETRHTNSNVQTMAQNRARRLKAESRKFVDCDMQTDMQTDN